MQFTRGRIIGIACGFATVWLAGCGGSGSHKAAINNNSAPLVVNAGPANNYANGLFTTVTICAPGTSNCQAVSGVLVDTMSYGVRILASAIPSVNNALAQQKDANGSSVAECAQFSDGITWGPVKKADVKIAGEEGYDAWIAGAVQKRGARKAVEIESLGITFESESLQLR